MAKNDPPRPISRREYDRYRGSSRLERIYAERTRDARVQDFLRDQERIRNWDVYHITDRMPPEQGPRRKWETISPHESVARERRSGPSPDFDNMRRVYDADSWHGRADRIGRKLRKQYERIPPGVKDAANVATRNLGHVLRAFDLIDYAGDWGGEKIIDGVEFPGYVRCDGPYPPNWPTNGMWYAPFSLHCTDFQLTGQGFGLGSFVPKQDVNPGSLLALDTSSPNQFMLGWTREGGAHWDENASYVRVGSATDPLVGTVAGTAAGIPMADTVNLERWLPGLTQPVQRPTYLPAVAPQNMLQELMGMSQGVQHYAASVPAAWAFSMSSNGGPPTPTPVRGREPPPKNEREQKRLSKVARVGIAAFKVLDQLSEAADVVDAVYEALPEDVKKRWKCNGGRGPVDNFGQYGIGHADCKLQALWHNWHRVDGEQAVVNILKNQLEDWIYGNIHKRLPKQAGGPAMQESWRQFAELMKSLGF